MFFSPQNLVQVDSLPCFSDSPPVAAHYIIFVKCQLLKSVTQIMWHESKKHTVTVSQFRSIGLYPLYIKLVYVKRFILRDRSSPMLGFAKAFYNFLKNEMTEL